MIPPEFTKNLGKIFNWGFGVVATILLYFGYAIAVNFFGTLVQEISAANANAEATLQGQASMSRQLDETIHESRKQTKVLERICINGARNREAAEDCIIPE